ncbi:pirin family protein [Leeuwenhoekiella parthenopeia]|uniref:Pirin family protein n=1 Tax=Leeuwenhoekiella parthenopeia TaxID=2890320 RepID=A0ABS8GTN4_9FLAO|nr:pirin family protein [Leeuwenhoekiella parthenopeia]MCC4213161.1 pirin family protein [Leeuwenhoekiella parthenopeia]
MAAIQKITRLQMPWDTQDPFLFCAFHNDNYPKGNGKLGPDASLAGRYIGQDFVQKDGWAMYHGSKVPGFPAHPHVGFETVTVCEKGFVDHSDSLGAAGRFGNGDVQWMTAGKGVQHSEMFPLLNEEAENPLLLFQIWLNLPAKSKKVEPYFGMMWNSKIPVIEQTDAEGNSIKIKLIAGSFKNQSALNPAPDSWAANPENDIQIWLISLDPNASFTLPEGAEDSNRSLYFYEGEQLEAEGFEIPVMHHIRAEATEQLTLNNGSTKAHLLLLQGKPIGEPVVKHGPFVGNSRKDIEDAFMRFQQDSFGGWPWPSNEHTHEPEKKRFAKYPDGKVENL